MSTTDSMTVLVDKLGKVKAQAAAIAAEEKRLVDQIKALGLGTHNGTLFDAVVFTQTSTQVDWAAIVRKAKISQRLIAANTTSKPITICKVTARTQAAA